MPDKRLLDRLRMLWLCEAIRQKEGTGSIDDTEVVTLLGKDITLRKATDEELIFLRAKRLILINPVAKALPRNIDIVLTYSGNVFFGLCFLALILGVSAAASVFSRSTTINIAYVYLALLGPHLLSLIWMILLLTFDSKSGRFSLGNSWLWLSERIGRRRDGVFLVESLRALVSKANNLPWLLMGISHILWLLFAVGCIISVLVFLGIEEYAFVWRTTNWSSEFFVSAVEITGWLPGLIGFSVPSSDDVAALKNVDSVRKSWAGWLVGSLCVYGVMPRLILLVVSYWTAIARLRTLSLDYSDPYYVALLHRIRSAFNVRDVILDPDPGNIEPTGPSLPTREGRSSAPESNVVVPYELRDPTSLACIKNSDDIIIFDNAMDHRSQSTILGRIGDLNIRQLAFVCDSQNVADRGAFQFFRILKSACPETRVVLMNRDIASQNKVANWLSGFSEIGLTDSEVLSDLPSLIKWMGASNR